MPAVDPIFGFDFGIFFSALPIPNAAGSFTAELCLSLVGFTDFVIRGTSFIDPSPKAAGELLFFDR
jgi:hypothetical protein